MQLLLVLWCKRGRTSAGGSVHSTAHLPRSVWEHPGTFWGAQRAPSERCSPPAGWTPCCWKKTAATSRNTPSKTPPASAHLFPPLLKGKHLHIKPVISRSPKWFDSGRTDRTLVAGSTHKDLQPCYCSDKPRHGYTARFQKQWEVSYLPVNEGDWEWMEPLLSIAMIWPTKSLGMKLANGKISVLINWTT